MKSFLSSIKFLTIIPAPGKEVGKNTVAFFPAAGIFLGAIIYILNFFLKKIFPQTITNAFILLVYTILTGGLHLDGLADTFDAISGSKGDRKKFFEILDDSRIGTSGTIALIFSIMLKFLLLTEKSLLIFPVVSRWSIVFSMFISKPAKEDGLGSLFIRNTNFGMFLFSTIFSVAIASLFLHWKGVIALFLVTSIVASIIVVFFTKKIGGITGDILGAINEISEILCLILLKIIS